MRINDMQFLADGTDGVFRPWPMTGREILNAINADPANAPTFIARASTIRGESIRSDIEIGVFWTQRYQVSYAAEKPAQGRWYPVWRWIGLIVQTGQLWLAADGLPRHNPNRW